jgi:hypothetical protein
MDKKLRIYFLEPSFCVCAATVGRVCVVSKDFHIHIIWRRGGGGLVRYQSFARILHEMAFLVEVSGHKLESSQARVFVWFSTLIFSSTKCYS